MVYNHPRLFPLSVKIEAVWENWAGQFGGYGCAVLSALKYHLFYDVGGDEQILQTSPKEVSDDGRHEALALCGWFNGQSSA